MWQLNNKLEYMKIIPILVLIFTANIAYAQLGTLPEKPHILIMGVDETDGKTESNRYLVLFEDIISSILRKEIPCAEIITRNDIKIMIQFDRERVLLNPDSESNLEAIGGAMGCNILISLTISKIGDTYFLGGSTLSTRNAKATGKYNGQTDINSLVKSFQKFANDMARDLLAQEICAYKGEFTINSVKTFNDSEEREGLPGQDCEFKATKEENDKTEEKWTFQKVKRVQADANVGFSIDNVKSETEHNTCNHCMVMEGDYFLDQFEPNKANMNFSTVITEKFNANKIANLDPEAKYEQYHAVVKIAFNTLANNYTIHVKAISEPAKWVRKSVYKESGCPYHKNTENEIGATYPVSIDRTFGPFLGSPYEKTLKKTETKTYIDPDSNGKGKTVETVTFNLTR